ncbi:MAG: LacI family DNA-binding transcriptional regulator [Oscillospiraceae bacterium]|nr:LacI family DNA-binding transcriptional regulator [Oscillospiraceae bacterium]
MVRKRVTMQQLADACGLSRNTVSKIFNDRGAVPEATRLMVMQRAQEMGYYVGPVKESPDAPRIQNIALLTCRQPADAHFGTFFLPAFAERLSRAGYTLMMYELTPEELREKIFPAHMPLEQTAGIAAIELFDRKYLDMLCALGLPCVTVDACAKAYLAPAECDCIAMESISSMAELTRHVIGAGARRLGFVGDPEHCDSFYQRWLGFCAALEEAGLTADRQLCILDADGPQYSSEDWLSARIRNMPEMPGAFICANDFLALHVMSVLKRMNLVIPDDIMVAGFDGTPQSAVVEPPLTTVQIPNADIGRMAADLLLERIQHPGHPFCITYVKTTPVWRKSTVRRG